MQFQDNTPYDVLTEKWNPVLNHDALPTIADDYRKKVTAVLLENQEQALRSQHLTEDMASNNLGMPTSYTNTGAVSGYDPVLISLVRRSMPNLMAYDICGVQPMTAPTGLIFAMRSNYQYSGTSSNTYGSSNYYEAMFQEPIPQFGGLGSTLGVTAGSGLCGYISNPQQTNVNIGGALGATLAAWPVPTQGQLTNLRGILTNNGEGIGNSAAGSAYAALLPIPSP